MATILKTSGEVRHVTLPPSDQRRLEFLRHAVGGYIEAVYGPHGQVMFVNEEGKLLGLPDNLAATTLYHAWLRTGDVIVGDAIVLTPEEAKEDEDDEEETNG
jgi:hypothetical protein